MWVAVGGTPESVVRAASLGLPMALAIIGGLPEQFVPLVDLYRRAGEEAGADPASLDVSINAHGYLADTSQEAADAFFPSYAETMGRIGRERGWSGITRAQYDAGRSPRGHLLVGSPAEVTEKLLRHHELFAPSRYLLQLSVGPMPHAGMLRAIELLGTEVAPAVRDELARRAPAATSSRPATGRRAGHVGEDLAVEGADDAAGVGAGDGHRLHRRAPADRRRALRPAQPGLARPGDVDDGDPRAQVLARAHDRDARAGRRGVEVELADDVAGHEATRGRPAPRRTPPGSRRAA